MENKKIKDMTKEEFREYKKQRQEERRMKMSKEENNEMKFKDKDAKRETICCLPCSKDPKQQGGRGLKYKSQTL